MRAAAAFAEASPQAVAGGSFVYRGLGFARCGMSMQSALRDNKNAVITDFDSACAGKATGTLYVDASGFPVKDPNIRQVADPNPKWTGGLHTSVTFGKLAGLGARRSQAGRPDHEHDQGLALQLRHAQGHREA